MEVVAVVADSRSSASIRHVHTKATTNIAPPPCEEKQCIRYRTRHDGIFIIAESVGVIVVVIDVVGSGVVVIVIVIVTGVVVISAASPAALSSIHVQGTSHKTKIAKIFIIVDNRIISHAIAVALHPVIVSRNGTMIEALTDRGIRMNPSTMRHLYG